MNCEICGSMAINHKCHGRDGTNDHLCDVCYWRMKAAEAELNLSNIESKLEALVDRCNKDCSMSVEDEVIAAEAALERLYQSRIGVSVEDLH